MALPSLTCLEAVIIHNFLCKKLFCPFGIAPSLLVFDQVSNYLGNHSGQQYSESASLPKSNRANRDFAPDKAAWPGSSTEGYIH